MFYARLKKAFKKNKAKIFSLNHLIYLFFSINVSLDNYTVATKPILNLT